MIGQTISISRKTFLLFVLFATGCQQLPQNEPNEASVQTGFFQIGDAKLYYEVLGEGHPVVLIHGGLLDRRMWDDQFEVFAQHYQAIRYDVREHGLSQGSGDSYFDHEDLYGLLSYLGIDEVVLIGLSMGGRIGIDFALEHPEMVRALIPVAPGLSGYIFSLSPEVRQNFNAAYQERDFSQYVEVFQQARTDGPHRTPDQVDAGVREKVRMMASEKLASYNFQRKVNSLQPPAINRLAEIQVPTLAILGTLDMPDISTIVDLLVEEIRDAEKVIVPDVAHMVNMERPEEFNQIVLDFLRDMENP